VIERAGSWLARQASLAMAWFDAQPGLVQLVIVVLVIVAIVALAHLDDLKRERRWSRMSGEWQRAQRRRG
jgi:Tfp pilus assembly protein PilX